MHVMWTVTQMTSDTRTLSQIQADEETRTPDPFITSEVTRNVERTSSAVETASLRENTPEGDLADGLLSSREFSDGARSLDGERWSPIPGFALYDASTHGRIRSWNQRGVGRHGVRAKAPRLLKLAQRPDGYVAVRIPRDDGVVKTCKVHRLVLMAWVGVPPTDPVNGQWEASHMSGVRNDNRLDNLAWEPPKMNFRRQTPHGRREGSVRRGERHHNAKFTADDVEAIRRDYAAGGVSQYELAERYGVTQGAISHVLLGRTWRSNDA